MYVQLKMDSRRAAILWLMLLLAFIPGCGGYGEVTPKAYQYATAIYSVTNRKAEGRLDELQKLIEASEVSEEITEAESDWLQAIVAEACEGNWEAASKQARAIMEDQVQAAAG